MTNLAILTSELASGIAKPFDDLGQNDGFAHLIELARAQDFNIVLASPDAYVSGALRRGWTYDESWQECTNFTVDSIWDRADVRDDPDGVRREDAKARGIRSYNSFDFKVILEDKFKTLSYCKDETPDSILIPGEASAAKEAIEELRGTKLHSDLSPEKIFLKPTHGFSAYGIIIVRGDDLSPLSELDADTNYLVQPFLETAAGVPGLGVSGRHDIRIVYFNDTPVMTYGRFPRGESLLSNISAGGAIDYFDIDSLPEQFLETGNKVARQLSAFTPCSFSIDMAQGESGKIWIFELNERPGLNWDPESEADIRYTKAFQKKSLEFLRANVFP